MATFNSRVAGAFQSLSNFRKNIGTLTLEAGNNWIESGSPADLNMLLTTFESKGQGSNMKLWMRYTCAAFSVQRSVDKNGAATFLPAPEFHSKSTVKENGKKARLTSEEVATQDWWAFGNEPKDDSAMELSALKKYLEGKVKDKANVTNELKEVAQQILDQHFTEATQDKANATNELEEVAQQILEPEGIDAE